MGASDTDSQSVELQQRRVRLQTARDRASELPCNEPVELAGRPNVYYELRDYSLPNKLDGSKQARSDVPYLFKSFETGQARPPRPGTKNAQLPRAATIHEYLDWTVTAQGSQALDELVRYQTLLCSAQESSVLVLPQRYITTCSAGLQWIQNNSPGTSLPTSLASPWSV